jgi:hypothetical protein
LPALFNRVIGILRMKICPGHAAIAFEASPLDPEERLYSSATNRGTRGLRQSAADIFNYLVNRGGTGGF